jgi:hypothetical protein
MKIRLKRLKLKDKNSKYLAIGLSSILISVILDFVNTFLKYKLNLKDTQLITFFIYGIVLLIAVFSSIKYRSLKFKKVSLYFIVLMFFALNYCLFENTREYLISPDMLIIYLFYLPISIFIITSITEWDQFLNISSRFSKFAIILSALGTIFLNYKENLNYMEFSYSVLPFIAIAYWNFREKKQLSTFVLFMIGFLNIIIFGARAPIGFVLIFVLAYELSIYLRSKTLTKVKIVFTAILIIFILFLCIPLLYNASNALMADTNSYFMQKLNSNSLFKLDDRQNIYNAAGQAIVSMGFHVYGLFGDRSVIYGITYVHSIIYEFLLSFGIIGGSIAIIALYGSTIVSFFKTKILDEKKIIMLFFITIIMRYFISGSFVIEGRFYLYIAIIYSLSRKRFKGHENCKHNNSYIQHGKFGKTINKIPIKSNI